MAGLLFVSQVMLDSWAEQGKIGFVGDVMTLLSGEGAGRRYVVEPAVRFMKIVGAEAGADPNGLLHKVKSVAQVKEMGGEIVGDSCLLGDVAYELEPGFLAERAALQAAAAARATRPPTARAAPAPNPAPAPARASGALPVGLSPAPAPAAAASGEARSRPLGEGPLPRELEDKRKEAEALARFLLENLS